MWISSKTLQHSINKDHLCDLLEQLHDSEEKHDEFYEYLQYKTLQFKQQVISYIHSNYHYVLDLSESNAEKNKDIINSKQHPILTNVAFSNRDNFTNGSIDMLIRSDLFVDIFLMLKRILMIIVLIHIMSLCRLFSSLPLTSNQQFLLNRPNTRTYKVESLLCNQALEVIQKKQLRYSYILGRRWSATTKKNKIRGDNCFEKLGVIDFKENDRHIIQKIDELYSWVRYVKTMKSLLRVKPFPNDKRLYPNMKIDTPKWNFVKEKIAQDIQEITQIVELWV